MRRAIAAAFSVAFLSSIATADLEESLPELRKYPAPTWIRAGVRLTFWEEDSRRKSPRAPFVVSNGPLQLTIVDAKSGAHVIRRFTSPSGRELEAPYHVDFRGVTGLPGGGEHWIHPAALQAILKRRKAGKYRATATTIKIEGKSYQAVKLRRPGSTYVFDAKSGVLLRYDYVYLPSKKYPTEIRSSLEYRGIEALTYPWSRAPMPGWIGTVKRYRYTGHATRWTPDAPHAQHEKVPVGVTLTRVGGGVNWALLRGELDAVQQGAKHPTQNFIVASSTLGHALPPGAMAKLKPGTVLERNKAAQSELKVVFVGAKYGKRRAILREEGPMFFLEWHYDLVSGVLLFRRIVDLHASKVIDIVLESAK